MNTIDSKDLVRCIMSPDDFIFIDGTRETGLGISIIVDYGYLIAHEGNRAEAAIVLDDAGIERLISILTRKSGGGDSE